jgi:hypothetical protein
MVDRHFVLDLWRKIWLEYPRVRGKMVRTSGIDEHLLNTDPGATT